MIAMAAPSNQSDDAVPLKLRMESLTLQPDSMPSTSSDTDVRADSFEATQVEIKEEPMDPGSDDDIIYLDTTTTMEYLTGQSLGFLCVFSGIGY